MENAEITLRNINSLLDFDRDASQATVYGVKTADTISGLDFKVIGQDGDVYDLIDNMSMDKTYLNYSYAVLKTTGWAAPLNANGDVDGAPSAHPERRRVRLFVVADIDNNEITGSVLSFDDDPENIIFDYNEATGSLAEAIGSLLR